MISFSCKENENVLQCNNDDDDCGDVVMVVLVVVVLMTIKAVPLHFN